MNLQRAQWPQRGWVSLSLFMSLVLCLGLCGGTALAAAVRLSFLEERLVLEDTCHLLEQHGCSAQAASTFGHLVQYHNQKGHRVDRTHFPTCQGGYYQFQSVADLTNRLSCCFYETPAQSPGQSTLMCFDVVCLLLRGAGYGAPRLEQDFGAKGVVLATEDGVRTPVDYQAFCASNHLLHPAAGYAYFVGSPRSTEETQLGLALRAARRLPDNCSDQDSSLQAAFAGYVKALQEDGFKFPQEFKLGLAFYVNLKHRYLVGDHAFLCIPSQGRLICLEKNGSRGPYVRVEFQSEADLGRYISWSLLKDTADPKKKEYGNQVLVSLNDRLIGIYRPGMQR